MKINLDACPFCGGKAGFTSVMTEEDNLEFHPFCTECGASGGYFEDIDAAVNGWNSRVYPEHHAKLIQERYCRHEPCEGCTCGLDEGEMFPITDTEGMDIDLEHGFMPHPEEPF